MRLRDKTRGVARWLLVLTVCVGGCAAKPKGIAPSVGDAWQESSAPQDADGQNADTTGHGRDSNHATVARTSGEPTREPAIATVNGHSITRRRLVGLLLRSSGAGVLEQLIVLDEAERIATARGLQVTSSEVRQEYENALRTLTDPLRAATPEPFDLEAAERALEAVLTERNISHEEFMLGMRRHAYLRKLVVADMRFTEPQLREEYDRMFGDRVQVRHIQLASPRDVARIVARLDAGENFSALAHTYSANLASAGKNGLLEPFAMTEDELPELFRRTAFALKPGEVSEAIRVGEWYHLLLLERRVPAEVRDFGEVRTRVERSLRERLTEPAMQQRYERIFREADIAIHDPVLREAFERVHGSRQR